jgi:hypothetical protein
MAQTTDDRQDYHDRTLTTKPASLSKCRRSFPLAKSRNACKSRPQEHRQNAKHDYTHQYFHGHASTKAGKAKFLTAFQRGASTFSSFFSFLSSTGAHSALACLLFFVQKLFLCFLLFPLPLSSNGNLFSVIKLQQIGLGWVGMDIRNWANEDSARADINLNVQHTHTQSHRAV